MTQLDLLLPVYTRSTSTLAQAPSYNQATASSFPTSLPCILHVRDAEKLNSNVSLHNPKADDLPVFDLQLLDQSCPAEDDQRLWMNLAGANAGFTSCTKLVVLKTHKSHYAVRKHVASQAYEIVSLDEDGFPGKCRRISPKTLLFKSKYSFQGLGGKEWAWKGSPGRSLQLYEYPTTTIGSPVLESGEFSPMPSSSSPDPLAAKSSATQASVQDTDRANTLPHVVSSSDKRRILLAEFQKSSRGDSLLQFHSLPTALGSTPSIETYAQLVMISLFPILDMYRNYLSSTFTTEDDLAHLQRQVRPSTWDSRFMSSGSNTASQRASPSPSLGNQPVPTPPLQSLRQSPQLQQTHSSTSLSPSPSLSAKFSRNPSPSRK